MRGLIVLFCMRNGVVSMPFVEKTVISLLNDLGTLVTLLKNQFGHRCWGFFVDFELCTVGLCVCLYAATTPI